MPRLDSTQLRNYVPGPGDPYDKAFYERVASMMDLESNQYASMGIQTTVYYNTETNTRDYDPPLPVPTSGQHQGILNQIVTARTQVEQQVWSEDPNQDRAQRFRDNFDQQVEKYKK